MTQTFSKTVDRNLSISSDPAGGGLPPGGKKRRPSPKIYVRFPWPSLSSPRSAWRCLEGVLSPRFARNLRFQISDLKFEICHLRSRRACIGPERYFQAASLYFPQSLA